MSTLVMLAGTAVCFLLTLSHAMAAQLLLAAAPGWVAPLVAPVPAAGTARKPTPRPVPRARFQETAAPRLRFKEDGTLKILQLTDLHYGESTKNDLRATQLQEELIAAEEPDVLVFSGDMVSGFACPGDTGDCPDGWFAGAWQDVTATAKAAGIPYAITLGNHDSEADLTRDQIVALDIDTGGNLTLTQQGPAGITGAANYWLDVASPDGSKVAARLWFLDSMDYGCEGDSQGYGCVGSDTVDWLRTTGQSLPPVPALAFLHIPIPQLVTAWNSGTNVVGVKEQDTMCPLLDTGLFAAAQEVGIGAIYAGHDHDNDFSAVLEGVRLAYGRKTGYGSYGPDGMQKGARVIQLVMDGDTSDSPTWIRQADGSMLQQEPAQPGDGTEQQECTVP